MMSQFYWDAIYGDRSDKELSWYQKIPLTSLKLIDELKVKAQAPIIDVGGGNSNLTSELSKIGFTNLSTLDISVTGLDKMKEKLGQDADKINWIASSILDFEPDKKYLVWHDRAVFHFLTTKDDKLKYKSRLIDTLDKNGYFLLMTFSIDGPSRCSGLEVCQYDLASLKSIFDDSFDLLNVFNEDHLTPAGKKQNFIISVWRKSM